MADRHVIENAVFEISFGSERDASDQQPGLDEFIKERLMPLVERLFDEFSRSGIVTRIEDLEIDLGPVPCSGYQEEMESRLEERLRAILQARMPSSADRPEDGAHGAADYEIRREEADLRQVQHFLLHGNLPWNSVLEEGLTIDDLVKQAVRSNGPQLAGFLRGSIGDGTVVRRLASQFSDEILTEISGVLAPSLSGSLSGVFDHLVRLWREEHRGAAPAGAARRMIWEGIISELLNAGPAPIVRHDLISRVARLVTRSEGMPPTADDTAGAAEAGAVGQRGRGPIESANDAGAVADGPVSEGDSSGGDGGDTPSFEIGSVRRRLAAAFLSGDAEALEAMWPVLVREQPEILVQAVRHYLRSARIRRNIVGAFPESMLGDILALLGFGPAGPVTKLTVAEMMDESTILVESLLGAQGRPLTQGDDVGGRVWEHALAYMLAEDKTTGFDPRAYVEGLIQKTVEDYDLAGTRGLLDAVAANPGSPDLGGASPSAFIRSVREIVLGEFDSSMADGQTGSQDPELPSRRVLRSYDLYDLLTKRLLGSEDSPGDAGSTAPLAEIIDELVRSYPWQLQKLYRDFQAGVLSADIAAKVLTPKELGHLIRAMLAVTERVEETSQSDLLRAVEAYAGVVRDLRRYYQRVLGYLAQGRLVDFDTIAKADRAPEESIEVPTESPIEVPPEALTGASPEVPPAAALAEEPISATGAGELLGRLRALAAFPDGPEEGQPGTSTATFEDLARTHPEDLRGLIQEMRTGALSTSDAAASLDAPELASLVRALLTVNGSTDGGAPLDLLRAIESHANRTADRHRYYRQILERVVQDQAIDLEQIAASDRAQPGSAGPGQPGQGPEAGDTPSLPERPEASAPPTRYSDRPSGPGQPPEPGEPPSPDQVRAYDLFQRLRDRLTQPSAPGMETPAQAGESAAGLIEELARAYPEQLQRLFREFQSGEVVAVQASAGLDAEELRRLVTSFLTLNASPGSGGIGELLQAIESYASRTADRHGFYRRILESVIQDRAIDLDAIAAGVPPAEAPEPPSDSVAAEELATFQDGAPEIGGARSPDQVRSYDLYQRLRDRLTQPLAPGTGAFEEADESAAGLIEELASVHPEQLQRLFREFQSVEATVAQASDRLNAEELRHLVTAFLTVNAPPGAGGIGELLRAIEIRSANVTDRHGYYRRILERVVQDQPIDLERIVASDRAQPGSAGPVQPGQGPDASDGRSLPERTDASAPPIQDAGGLGAPGELPEAGEPPSPDLVRAYDLYQRLRDRLTQPLAQGVEGFGEASESAAGLAAGLPTGQFEELARAYPEQLRRLFRELQAGGVRVADVAARLSADELAHLVQALVVVNVQPDANGPSDFLDSIRVHAQRAEDVHRFYTQLLTHLVQDRLIDLDAIAAGDIAPPGSAEEQTAAASQTAGSALGPLGGPMAEADAIQALDGYMRRGAVLDSDDASRLIQSIEALLTEQSRALRQMLERRLDSEEAASRLISLLPDRLLTRVLYLERPSEHHLLQRTGDILADTLYAEELGLPAHRVRDLKWRSIFHYVFDRGLVFRQNTFVRDFVEFIAGQPGLPGVEDLRGVLAQQLASNILPTTQQLQLQIFRALTRYDYRTVDAAAPVAPDAPAAGPAGLGPDKRDNEVRRETEEERPSGDTYIGNAGLVLAAPYIQRLFEMLELTGGPAFKDSGAAERAVHLLQFLADESTASPEHLLTLNKILCGVRPGLPIVREIDITAREKETVEGLIQGMVQNWKVLGNTSIAGFRESFLQRDGRLQLNNDAWHLMVEPRPFDMLLDQIPWSFSTIKLPWMERVVYVEWR